MANAEVNRASSTLLSFTEPSLRHSGFQYHPPNSSSAEFRPQSQLQPLDGGEPVRFYQSHGYPLETGPHELSPHIQHLDSQAQSVHRGEDGGRDEVVEEKKHRWSSASLAARPIKLATILVIWTIIIVAVAVGGGVGGAVVSKCSKRTEAAKSNAAANGSETNSTSLYELNDYTPAPQTAVNTTKLDCPAIDGLTYSARAGPASFNLVCDRFYQNSERIWTIGRINVYTPDECWEGCANMNQWTKKNLGWDDPPCDFASFSTLMADMWEAGQGNCIFFHKNNGEKLDDTWGEFPGTAISAVLVQ